MENNSKKIIDDLNNLVEINNDRIKGYQTAMNEAKESDLRDLFRTMSDHSQTFRNELSNEINKLGGKPAEGTKTTGKIFRAWMDIRAALTNKNRKAILDSCERGEDAALETYNDVLKSENLTQDLRSMVSRQKDLIQKDHDTINSMKETVKA